MSLFGLSLASNLFGGSDSRNYGTSRDPSPFPGGQLRPRTAYETRKRAGRIYAPARAALVAQEQLLGPTLDLQRRAGMGYADLFGDIAPEYVRGYEEADPDTSGLLQLWNLDARSLLNRGASDINEDTELQDLIRGSQASHGLAYSPGSSLEELINLDRGRDTRRMARGRYAGEAVEAGRRYYSPTLLSLMQQYGNPVQGTSTDDLLSLSLADTAGRRAEQAGRRAGQMALTGQIIGSVLGAGGAAAVGCWVAEELYGVDDVRTHLARAWVRAHPQNGFVRLYQRHGRQWARWLAVNPWAKPILRPIWDAMWRAQAARTLNFER